MRNMGLLTLPDDCQEKKTKLVLIKFCQKFVFIGSELQTVMSGSEELHYGPFWKIPLYDSQDC